MIGKTNAQTIIQSGGGGDDMVLYHATQTISGNNSTISLTTYNGETSDNYWVGTKTVGRKQELFLVSNEPAPEPVEVTKYSVEFRDIDGTLIDSQEVEEGGSVTIPSATPNYDSDYLEFVEWRYNGDLTDVDANIVVLPFYRTRLDSNLNKRPTYLFCYFDSSTLQPTLNIGNFHTNTYIDWGDGSSVEQITTSTISHTYATEGYYVITMYGDQYTVGGNSNAGIFTTTAFNYCLKKAYLGENAYLPSSGWGLAKCYALTEVVLPENQTTMGSNFYYDYSLKTIVLPSRITTIGGNCFYYCKSLKYVVFPNGVTSMGDSSFSYCDNLKSIILPNTVTILSSRCFVGNRNLKSVKLSSGLTNLPNYCFAECYSLEKIVLPSGITRINSSAFNSCRSLKELDIPSTVTTIDSNFTNVGLESIEIPHGVTTLSDTFTNAYMLRKISLPNTLTTNITINSDTVLEELVLESGFRAGLNLAKIKYVLKDEILIDIAEKLADLTGETTKTLTLNKVYLGKLETLQVSGSSWTDFVTNKNWTISINS